MNTVCVYEDIPGIRLSWWMIKRIAVIAYCEGKTFNDVCAQALQHKLNEDNQ